MFLWMDIFRQFCHLPKFVIINLYLPVFCVFGLYLPILISIHENSVSSFFLSLFLLSFIQDYCPPDITYIDSPDGDIELRITIVWPEILRGKTQAVICPCDFQLSTSDLIATRECGGNVGTVAQWGRRYDSPCNFTVTTRRLCKLANVRRELRVHEEGLLFINIIQLTISELLSGLDDITTNAGNIDSAGVSVTAVALDTVEEDVIRNDTVRT